MQQVLISADHAGLKKECGSAISGMFLSASVLVVHRLPYFGFRCPWVPARYLCLLFECVCVVCGVCVSACVRKFVCVLCLCASECVGINSLYMIEPTRGKSQTQTKSFKEHHLPRTPQANTYP